MSGRRDAREARGSGVSPRGYTGESEALSRRMDALLLWLDRVALGARGLLEAGRGALGRARRAALPDPDPWGLEEAARAEDPGRCVRCGVPGEGALCLRCEREIAERREEDRAWRPRSAA